MFRRQKLLQRLIGRLACARGNTAVLFALMLPFVIGGAGFGAETSYWYYKHIRLQAAADQAAYAGALIQKNGGSSAQMTAAATTAASNNGWDSVNGTIQVNNPPKSGPNQNSMAVEVILNEPETRFFTSYFSSTPVIAGARAVASFQKSSVPVCVLALSSTGSGAVNMSGSSSLTLDGCSMLADSIDPAAVTAAGSTQASMPCLYSVGGAQITSGITLTSCSSPVTGVAPLADPYANQVTPTVPSQCNTSSSGSTLSAGCYRNGLSITGNVSLNPGVYIINGGTLKFNGGANITGTGVTFYLTNGASVDMNGNAYVNLSAPTSGSYAGMLFMDDRTSLGGSNVFNGNASSHMTGALYFPTQAVQYSGNFSGANGCTYIVANTVSWTGNTTFTTNCSAYSMSPPVLHLAVSMME